MSGMPSITIKFTELAASAIQRGDRGIIAMILRDTVPATNPVVVSSINDIPSALSAANKKYLEFALMGYVNTPKKVIAYVIASDAENYADAFSYLRTVKWHYLVVPTVATDELTSSVVSFITTERSNDNLVKAILPNTAGDSEGIINYTTSSVVIDDVTYTAEEYAARIAGVIAGTPLTMSATYAPLTECSDCSRLSKADMDTAVNAGKFIVWWDGEKVKTARAVNSLTTLTAEKNAQFQKIKIVEAMDMIADDIRMTVQDNYIGKFPNTYDNKQLLVAAIGTYFLQLQQDQVLQSYEIGIDIDANRSYLQDKGIDVDDMTDDEIKRANTGTNVFLKATLSILDAIEDVTLKINI